jgi:sarcosine oxidase
VKREYAFAVLGLGGIGSGAAYWLGRAAGDDVIGLEQFELGHANGASEDHSRIIRRSYHTPGYVELAGHAYEAWTAVEAEAGEELVLRTGGLDLWPGGAAIPMEDYSGSLRAQGIPFEELDAAEIMQRWPQWRLTGDVRGIFQEDGGIVAASRANRAHRRLAQEYGVFLQDRTQIEDLHSSAGEIDLRTSDGDRYRCGTLVVAADAWTNEVLEPLGVHLPLTVTEEHVTFVAPQDPSAFAPARFPVWIWMDDPSFYGVPTFGEAGPKVAQDVGGPEVTPGTRAFRPDAAAAGRVRAFIERYLPSMLGPVIVARTCLYTLTPDRDFVLDALPGHPNVLVSLGAAHGFKFASLFGRILAKLAMVGRTTLDIGPFAVDRPVLTMDEPPRRFLI